MVKISPNSSDKTTKPRVKSVVRDSGFVGSKGKKNDTVLDATKSIKLPKKANKMNNLKLSMMNFLDKESPFFNDGEITTKQIRKTINQ